jgi:hypothetical protein
LVNAGSLPSYPGRDSTPADEPENLFTNLHPGAHMTDVNTFRSMFLRGITLLIPESLSKMKN